MAGGLLPQPKQLIQDNAWNPGIEFQLYTYEPASLTPKITHQDAAQTIANTNPVVANARGEVVMYGSGSYRVILKDSLGNTIWDRDNIDTLVGGASLVGSTGASQVGYDDTTVDVYLKSRLGRVVGSISALRALNKTKNTQAVVSGYYAAGDGGGGTYSLDAADTTTADNGGTVIVATDGGRWKLSYDGAVSIKQFGAKGDGTTNDAPAVQAAVNAGLLTLYVPPTLNGYRLTAPITITAPVTLMGGGTTPYGSNGPYTSRGIGSWFFIDHLGIGFNVGRSTITEFLSTVAFEKIGTYRTQPVPGAGWTPTDFGFDFQASNTDVIYRDLMLHNATRGIQHLNGDAGRVVIDNVRGQFFKIGINIDKALDSVRLDKFHAWPFWSNDAAVTAYMSNTLVAISLNRCDNPHFSNIFAIFANIVLGIYQNASGTVSKLRVANADFDICRYAIFVDAAVSGATAQFANITSYGPDAADLASYNIRVLGSSCRLDFVNLEGQNLSRGLIRVEGTGNKVQMLHARANTWARADAAAPLIENLAANTMHINSRVITDGPGTALIINAGTLFYPGLVTNGSAIIDAAATSVVVNHNLPLTPTSGQVQVWMLTGTGAAKAVFASGFTATQFTINCDVAPTVGITVAWRASLE